MQPSPAEMAQMIFKQSIPDGLFEFKCNTHMLKVLLVLNGTDNPAAISKKTGLPPKAVSDALLQLLNLQLVTAVQENGIFLDRSFLDFLQAQFSAAIGPVAEFIIEETIKDLGHHVDSFPKTKAADLIMALAKDIQREDKKLIFKQNMIVRMKQG
ncbi:MAG: hypothetical protein V2B20_26455 [Pseudomonadota bacterium]